MPADGDLLERPLVWPRYVHATRRADDDRIQGPRLLVELNAMVQERVAKGRRPSLEHLLQDHLLSRRKFADAE